MATFRPKNMKTSRGSLSPATTGYIYLRKYCWRKAFPRWPKSYVVGAGGGKEVVTFGKAFPDAHLTGVDPSEKMLGYPSSISARG